MVYNLFCSTENKLENQEIDEHQHIISFPFNFQG